MADKTLDQRMNDLGARIAAARKQLEAQKDFEDDEVGDVLETINKDFEEVVHDDDSAAHSAYDRIEKRLADIQPYLSTLPR